MLQSGFSLEKFPNMRNSWNKTATLSQMHGYIAEFVNPLRCLARIDDNGHNDLQNSSDFSLAYDFPEIYKGNMIKRERFSTTFDSELLEKLKILAIYEKCTTNKLLEEAIRDLLKKYEKKRKK